MEADRDQEAVAELVGASVSVLTRLPALVEHPLRTTTAEAVLRRVGTQAVSAACDPGARELWLEFCAADLSALRDGTGEHEPLRADLELLVALVETLRAREP